MSNEEIYLIGCLLAINMLVEKGSSHCVITVNNNSYRIPWIEIINWITDQVEMRKDAKWKE